MRWIDLSPYSIRLTVKRLPSGVAVLAISGAHVSRHARSLAALGFAQRGDVWYSTRFTGEDGRLTNFSPSVFREKFPNLLIREMTPEEISGAKPPVAKKPATILDVMMRNPPRLEGMGSLPGEVALHGRPSTRPVAGSPSAAEARPLPKLAPGIEAFYDRLNRFGVDYQDATGKPIRDVAVLQAADQGAKPDFTQRPPAHVQLHANGNIASVTFMTPDANDAFQPSEVFVFQNNNPVQLYAHNKDALTLTDVRRYWRARAALLNTGRLEAWDEIDLETYYFGERYSAPEKNLDADRGESLVGDADATERPSAFNALMAARVLGLNHLGETVVEDADGRYIRANDAKSSIKEAGQNLGARFLRARVIDGEGRATIDWQSLALCADGFALEIAHGKAMEREDLFRFASAVFDIPEDAVTQPLVQFGFDAASLADGANATAVSVCESAIQAAVALRFQASLIRYDRNGRGEAVGAKDTPDLAPEITDEAFAYACQIQARLPLPETPTHSVIPLPISAVMQRLILKEGVPDDKIHVQGAGNGEIITQIGLKCSLTVWNENKAHQASVERIAQSHAAEHHIWVRSPRSSAISPKSVRRVIGAPRPGLLSRQQSLDSRKRAKTLRGDLVGMVRALETMADDGRAVFLVDADVARMSANKHGHLEHGASGSRDVFEWIARNYRIEGIADIHPSLTGRREGKSGLRIVAINGRHPAPLDGELGKDDLNALDSIPIFRDYGSLWQWSKDFAFDPATYSADIDVQEINDYQVKYVPLSNLDNGNVMIPRFLQASTQEALSELHDEVGDVDDFVAERLMYSRQELAEYYSAEQIDALALAIRDYERGDGMLIGDQTGLGKGRILAGMARYAVLHGINTAFITETDTLFTDFWRDVVDTGSADLIKPMLLNTGSVLFDQQGAPVHRGRKGVIDKSIAIPAHPAGFNMVIATYSQFNRDADGSKKTDWLRYMAAGGVLITDEAHNAAGGTSNTSQSITAAIGAASGVVYSSATFVREPKNIGIYSAALPLSDFDIKSIEETLEKGGEPLQEIFVSEVVKSGTILRREQNLDNIEMRSRVDKNPARNEALADKFAEVVEAIVNLTGEANIRIATFNKEMRSKLKNASGAKKKTGNQKNKAIKSANVKALNFGSRLSSLAENFLLGLRVDEVSAAAIDAIKEGRRPVIALENTMESLLSDVLTANDLPDLATDADDVESALGDGVLITDTYPQFRHLLANTVRRLVTTSHVTASGQRTDFNLLDPDALTLGIIDIENQRILQEGFDAVMELIEQFPDMSISPIDQVIEKIGAAGYVCGELSARKSSIQKLEDGRYMVGPRENINKNRIIRDFNYGEIDALVMTRVGTTGISMHAHKAWNHQQRELIEMQVMGDVARRIQLFGRFNRKGQVNTPIITTVSSGLPAENRQISMENRKLRKMFANTTANRDSAFLNNEVVDIMNRIGDVVCLRYLQDNPQLANRMGFDLQKIEAEADNPSMFNGLASQFTFRLITLPVKEQVSVFNEVAEEYRSSLEALEAQGINPFKSKEFDIKATVVERQLYEGVEKDAYRSAFERPVYLSTIEYKVELDPLRKDTVLKAMDAAIAKFQTEYRIMNPGDLSDICGDLESVRHTMLQAALTEDFDTIQDALASDKPNAVKHLNSRFNTAIDFYREAGVGKQIVIPDPDNKELLRRAIVVDMTLPPRGREHLLGQCKVKLAVPGESRMEWYSAAYLTSVPYSFKEPDLCMEQFDRYEKRTVKLRRCVLDGNLFKAAQLSNSMQAGVSAVYTDAHGNRLRGVVMPVHMSPQMLLEHEVYVPAPQIFEGFLNRLPEMAAAGINLPRLIASTVRITDTKEVACYLVTPDTYPGPLTIDLHYKAPKALIKRLVDECGVAQDTTKKGMILAYVVPASAVSKALEVLYESGHAFTLPSKFRNEISAITASLSTRAKPDAKLNSVLKEQGLAASA